jgi:hypothetical protein
MVTAPVSDNEGRLLQMERRYREKRANIRMLQEQIAREEEEEEGIRNEYVGLLNLDQARVFANALDDDNVDAYLSAVIGERQQTTLPRTWNDYNNFTRSI